MLFGSQKNVQHFDQIMSNNSSDSIFRPIRLDVANLRFDLMLNAGFVDLIHRQIKLLKALFAQAISE